MFLIKKIIKTYQYIYFRLLIFQIKQWQGIQSFGSFNSGYGISASAVALIYSLDLIYRQITGTNGFFNDVPSILIMALSIVIIHSIIFSQSDEKLMKKYIHEKEDDPYWKLKGYLSLSFVFGPFILLFLLIYNN